ncbi:MAG: PEGA domain-containing protein [Chitinivibrionales bacterium]|nr:PEGA domain-containing protein [Chitinivibrionales bacterium]
MKIPATIFGLALLCFAQNAASGNYTIPLFASPEKQKSGFSSNEIITTKDTTPLHPQDELPEIKPGEVVLRKKINANTYAVYHGIFTDKAFSPSANLYYFPFKENCDLSKLIRLKTYSYDEKDMSKDIEEVYFDNERIYIRNSKTACYNVSGLWKCLKGTYGKPAGSINLSSDPPKAKVFINGIDTKKQTPVTLTDLFAGNYIIELTLPHYTFARKRVVVVPDTTIYASFEFLSEDDTVYIAGDRQYGILILPLLPIDTPYSIDEQPVETTPVKLNPGIHHIRWQGGPYYSSLDTGITIESGKVSYFYFYPQRLHGTLHISSKHTDATITLNDSLIKKGDFRRNIPTGMYTIHVEKDGYTSFKRTVFLPPDSLLHIEADLKEISDRDKDGYPDTEDKCPDDYGLFDGCRRPRSITLAAEKIREVMDTLHNDNLNIGFNALSYIHKTASRKSIRHLLALYDDGNHIMDNYRGLTAGNNFFAYLGGVYISCEFGQWFSGLKYRRSDTASIGDSKQSYTVSFDSSTGKLPNLYLTSTALSLGIHFGIKNVNVSYSIGYQWEDLIFTDVFDVTSNTLQDKLTLDNDWWFHRIHSAFDFPIEKYFTPGVFASIKIPFGKARTTYWRLIEYGIQFKFSPSLQVKPGKLKK